MLSGGIFINNLLIFFVSKFFSSFLRNGNIISFSVMIFIINYIFILSCCLNALVLWWWCCGVLVSWFCLSIRIECSCFTVFSSSVHVVASCWYSSLVICWYIFSISMSENHHFCYIILTCTASIWLVVSYIVVSAQISVIIFLYILWVGFFLR